MKIKILIIISILFISINAFSQQIGDGRSSEITDFTVPLKSGGFQAYNPIGGNPDTANGWQHLFVIRHSNDNNNYQLQLSSRYTANDRLFFRKIASGGLESMNPTWIELATRGINNFIGDQNVTGNQNISGNLNLGKDTEVSTISGPGNSGAIQIKTHSALGGSLNRYLRLGFKDNNSVFYPSLSINDDLNVGIGTTSPKYKLDVVGAIRAREIKVNLDGADFVFESGYKLMPLNELEKFVKVNKHLPEIAPAKEMQENGANLGDLNTKLLQKIEELTLYTIEQNKKIEKQNEKILVLEEKFRRMETISK